MDAVEADIKPLWQIEKDAIEQAIEICDGNIPKAAGLLQISASTIYRKRQAWEERVLRESA
jgi:two-component system repressor protein LuxO